jgi:hypothetical protein
MTSAALIGHRVIAVLKYPLTKEPPLLGEDSRVGGEGVIHQPDYMPCVKGVSLCCLVLLPRLQQLRQIAARPSRSLYPAKFLQHEPGGNDHFQRCSVVIT